ncbi:MAG: hypothetical protein IT445_19930 [Phycisphaeraceae bacterium]|nr:hypothetical protein [Phycisphaeraceae bacterium]
MPQHTAPIPVDRPLTTDERQLVQWMLKHGKPEASSFLIQLDRARVVALCPCGCASINFAVSGMPAPEGGMNVLADFLFGDVATLCGAFIFEKNGVLAGLEVYGFAVDAPGTLPKPSDLRRFEAAALPPEKLTGDGINADG